MELCGLVTLGTTTPWDAWPVWNSCDRDGSGIFNSGAESTADPGAANAPKSDHVEANCWLFSNGEPKASWASACSE